MIRLFNIFEKVLCGKTKTTPCFFVHVVLEDGSG